MILRQANSASINKTVTAPTRALNTTYANSRSGSILVTASVRCAITLAAGSAYVIAKSDSATPPVTAATGKVGIEVGLLNEDNTAQISFVVAAGMNYRIDSTVANGTATLGDWRETAF